HRTVPPIPRVEAMAVAALPRLEYISRGDSPRSGACPAARQTNRTRAVTGTASARALECGLFSPRTRNVTGFESAQCCYAAADRAARARVSFQCLDPREVCAARLFRESPHGRRGCGHNCG